MLDRVAATIARYGMFTPGQRVGVAVSGGADSVCLLLALRELAPGWDLALSVLHLNHQLRGGESDADERYVEDIAARFGLEVRSARADVLKIASETGDNMEQAARRVRRAFFLDFLRRGVVDRVALGHTRSDQAETVLFRFLRGAGTAGLAGMRPATREGLVRPLIEIERAEVEQLLRDRGVAWREDASNLDPRFARNRIRHDLLPRLAVENPALPATLARLAAVAADEERYWEGEIERVVEGRLVLRPPAVLFRVDWIEGLDRAVARRVIRRAVQAVKGDLRSINMEHIERILELTGNREGSARLQAPGLDVFRSFDWVRLAPPATGGAEGRNYEFAAPVPGKVELPGGRSSLSLELEPPAAPAGSAYNKDGTELDWDRISGGLRIRNWRPGDRYRPIGHASETKIKFLFQEARIPLWERRGWPVMTCGDAIVWSRKFGPAVGYAVSGETRSVLRVRELGDIGEF
ncbi:MAG: tRNA lysidine(34) synthetase TilS [Bryobacteraceae bacterium]